MINNSYKFILISLLINLPINVLANNSEEKLSLALDHKSESKTEKLKQWVKDHKVITTVSIVVAILGIGTLGHFLNKKSIDINIKKKLRTEYLGRLTEIAKNYKERIDNIEECLTTFNQTKNKTVLEKTYAFLPERIKKQINADIQRKNPSQQFSTIGDFAKLLTIERLEYLANRELDNFKRDCEYVNQSILALTNRARLKTTNPKDYSAFYSTNEKIKHSIEEDLSRATESIY